MDSNTLQGNNTGGLNQVPVQVLQNVQMNKQQQQHQQGRGPMVVGSILTPPAQGTIPQQPGAAPGNGQPVHHGMAPPPAMVTGMLPASQQPAAETNGAVTTEEQMNLANTKEKTPMCLVNELARFNKIPHQYTLTDEQGPAHKKTFFVKLKLGEEEYACSGPSIKKAQHAAADIALGKTEYKHPPPKPPKNAADNGYGQEWTDSMNTNITPTVELNALAMKRGEPALYQQLEQQRPPYPPPNFNFRGMYNQRYHHPRYPRQFYVSLKVGQREFIGEGNTRQAARHTAASKALKVLRALPMPNQDATAKPAPEAVESSEEGVEKEDVLKSEISLVHEIALKRNMAVDFKVLKESGPPHMRVFVTQCTCGEYTTEAEGNSKKLSKKRAAEHMLEELKKLPTLPPTVSRPKKPVGNKKKNRNLIKKADPGYGQGINPISRLIQIQQAKKEKEPVYELMAEKGLPRRREFVMQVTVGDQSCTGVGPNKKLAKRNAAEAMLQQLGYSRPAPQPTKPAIKTGETSPLGGDKKVTFMEQEANHSRQMIPGVLLMPEGSTTGLQNQGYGGMSGMQAQRTPGVHFQPAFTDMGGKHSAQTTATIAQELLQTGTSPTAESLTTAPSTVPVQTTSTVRPKQQLLYLAEVLGIQVSFTDFPKGSNKNEYLSLVSLSTSPSQVWHGAGTTIEASHDAAALTGLKAISEMGLDKVAAGAAAENKDLDNMAGGDGPHIKTEQLDKRANSADNKLVIKTEPSN